MISLILFVLGRQGDIGQDLEQALAGKSLAGTAFHQAVDPVLEKYGGLKTTTFKRTTGDSRGLVLTIAGSGPNWDETKTWRIFLWQENTKIRAQVIKRFGDYSASAIDSYTDGQIYWRGDRLVIVGRDYDGSTSSRAGLTSYIYEDAHWKLLQHLASERQGSASFAILDRSIDPARILVRTRLRPDNFRVPSSGPMLTYSETWVLKEGKYAQSAPVLQKTAAVELDRLFGLVAKKNRKSFDAAVPEPYRDQIWNALSTPGLVVEGVGKGDVDSTTSFKLGTTNIVVTFVQTGGEWRLAEIAEL